MIRALVASQYLSTLCTRWLFQKHCQIRLTCYHEGNTVALWVSALGTHFLSETTAWLYSTCRLCLPSRIFPLFLGLCSQGCSGVTPSLSLVTLPWNPQAPSVSASGVSFPSGPFQLTWIAVQKKQCKDKRKSCRVLCLCVLFGSCGILQKVCKKSQACIPFCYVCC